MTSHAPKVPTTAPNGPLTTHNTSGIKHIQVSFVWFFLWFYSCLFVHFCSTGHWTCSLLNSQHGFHELEPQLNLTWSLVFLNVTYCAREVAQRLGALAPLTEDLSSICSTYIQLTTVHTPISGGLTLFPGLQYTLHTCGTQMHIQVKYPYT